MGEGRGDSADSADTALAAAAVDVEGETLQEESLPEHDHEHSHMRLPENHGIGYGILILALFVIAIASYGTIGGRLRISTTLLKIAVIEGKKMIAWGAAPRSLKECQKNFLRGRCKEL